MSTRLTFYPPEFLWPDDVPQTRNRKREARYKQYLDEALTSLRDMLRQKFGAVEAEVGIDRSRSPVTPAVVVRFVDRRRRQIVLACDQYVERRWNVRALCYALEALWRMERDGTSQVMEQIVSGKAVGPALPPPGTWPWDVLGLQPGATRSEVESAYRARSKEAHPDSGGSNEAFQRIRAAYDEARALAS